MSQEPTGNEISTASEKLMITNDLEKNRENTETSLFKPKILCATGLTKEKKRNSLISTPSMTTYLGRKPLTLTKFLLTLH